jgi:uncharacterized membrane protein YqaE (UPF0057 family)
MKNKLQAVFVSALSVTLLLGSCARDNSVASNHGIQKRKYTSGYHVHFKGLKKSINEQETSIDNSLAKTEILEVNSNENTIVQNYDLAQTVASNQAISTSQANSSNKTIEKEEVKVVKSKKVNTVKSNEVALSVNKTAKKEVKNKVSAIKELSKKNSFKNADTTSLEPIVYVLLCLFIPFVAVGLATDWNIGAVILNLLLTCLCGIPGIIHAFIVCKREGAI